jgi:hypothetical protein
MKYPEEYSHDSEPKQIHVGDLVWWNEGTCVGFIIQLIEEEADRKDYSTDESEIVFSNFHPFAANTPKYNPHTGSFLSGCSTIYPERMLEDEGIGLLSPHERSEFDWAISKAKQAVSTEHRDLPFYVNVVMNLDSRIEDWVFQFVDQNYQKINEEIIFPLRPNTRYRKEK